MDENRVNILIIEDIPVYVLVLKSILQQNHMDCEDANTLAGGVKLAGDHSFDAVLLDLGLPDSRGLQTYINFSSVQPTLPVIILSGLDDQSIAAKAVQLGAQDYLTKGNNLLQGDAGGKLILRSIQYAIERQRIQVSLMEERSLLEQRVSERTQALSEANQNLRMLAARLISAQEDERQRISMELHDEAGQALTALQMSLAMIRAELQDETSKISCQLQEAIDLTTSTMEQLRTLAHRLRPPSLDNVGLDQTLRDYCQRIEARGHLRAEYKSAGIDQLPGPVQISLYRIVQEALTNVLKHARAHRVWVRVESDAEGVSLSVIDDGIGIPSEELSNRVVNSGIGLLGMRERVEALGGTFGIFSEPEMGTSVRVHIPLQEVS